MLPLTDVLAYICGIWSLAVFLVQGIGIYQLFRHYSAPRQKAVSASRGKENAPHITIIRPVKGIEPQLYECLVSTFLQDYPIERFSIHLCIESADDPAYPILQRVVAHYPHVDARIYVETEDPVLHGSGGHVHNLGPNPKIRNMSRAYREAKGDVIWIIDCNVWVAPGAAGRMVDKLYGFLPDGKTTTTAYKFVHHLPAVVDVSDPRSATAAQAGGGRLDEMFMGTSHAKFYMAINTVGIAPCILGKSNMFRKSHLDALTDPATNPILSRSRAASRDGDGRRGIDFFSSNICEDHLIGDLLWRSRVPGNYGNHGLVLGDLAVQPIRDMSLAAYVGRRVRWLRVRKWTVTLATLVEPGVEAFLCSLYFAFAATTIPPAARELAGGGLPPTWSAMLACWLATVLMWMLVDWCTYRQLLAFRCIEADENTPAFARPMGRFGGGGGGVAAARPFGAWVAAWLGREALALPIWTWAVLLGTTVSWRGKSFYVRPDMTVVEIDEEKQKKTRRDGLNGKAGGNASLAKDRIE